MEINSVDDQSSAQAEIDVVDQEANLETTTPEKIDEEIGQLNPLAGIDSSGIESSVEAPPAHESLQTDGSEDVIATAVIQLEAADHEIKRLEEEASAPGKDEQQARTTEPSTPIREVPGIRVEFATPTTSSTVKHNGVQESPQNTTLVTRKLLSTSSLYFIKKTTDLILASREGKKKGPLRDVILKTNDLLQAPPTNGVDPNAIFEPLRLACESQSVTVTTQALDCLGKLIAISFFDAPPPNAVPAVETDEDNPVPSRRADAPTRPLMDRVIDTVCECFQGEGTDEKVQLQIIKALLSAVLNETEGTMIHQSPLLKAIRQTYNIFLLSRSTPTQSIAQGTLEQMVHAVFSRVRIQTGDELHHEAREEMRISPALGNGATHDLAKSDGRNGTTTNGPADEKVTLDSFARRQSFDQIPDQNLDSELILSQEEILVKDAFLIFRSMCKLSTKNLAIDGASDLKSHMVRSKLLSLHMISTILNRHISIFLSPLIIIRSSATSAGIQFIQATKQYLCHALSRNAVSHIPQVFQVSCEIFWRILDSLRVHLKKEIEVFLIEIYLPILEMKTSSYQQKLTFMNVLTRLCNDPRALVEVYLNYDCDRGAMDNMYER